MRRTVIVSLLLVLAVLAIVGGTTYFIYNNYMYYKADDAQVTGTIVSVSAPITGQLATLSVRQGDKVTAGQTLATITPAPTTNATGARIAPTPINVTSPINGTILQTSVVEGQGVASGLNIIQLTDLSSLTVTAYVDENAINNVSVGQNVDVTVDAYSGTTFTGHIHQIVQAAAAQFSLLPSQDNASGNFSKVSQRIPVIVTLDGNAGKDVVPGMSAETTIHLH